ncbi:MAG: T9SS C-terminal target domain-containing protein [Cytophagales bacterium]|nr:MAG: T9SS C-terminal target domain-containing protein [Cytophagales bacterium]TAF60765.1 MAG: T9SS C-terminal target domain-containing protein [Cytophagales bacterium]
MKLKISVLFCMVLLFAMGAESYAQDHPKRHQGRKEARTYIKKNILPVVLPLRARLDEQLNDAEKLTIASTKATLKQLRAEARALRKQVREYRKNDKPVPEALRQQLQALRDKKQTAVQPVKAIAEARSAEITALLSEIETQKAQWKTDLQAIRERHGNKNRGEGCDNEGKDKACEEGKGKCPLMMMFSHVGFLLLEDRNDEETLPNKQANLKAEVFPNPSSTANRISFELTESSMVSIDLLSKQGLVLKNVLNETRTVGKHTVSVDLNSLSDDVYYFRIKTSKGVETKRFIVEK